MTRSGIAENCDTAASQKNAMQDLNENKIMPRKKIGGIESDVIMTGGLLIGGYLLLRNVIPNFLPGGGVSDQDRQTLDSQATTDPQHNIFNTQSLPYSTWFNVASNGTDLFQQFGVDNSTDLYLKAYRSFLDGSLSPSSPLYAICAIYHNLHGAVTGHILTGDQQGAIDALNAITNKWQVGALSELWGDEYGGFGTPSDMFSVIRNGSWPMMYGLNGTDLAAQVTRLNNLPD